jgi:hypothetical protein
MSQFVTYCNGSPPISILSVQKDKHAEASEEMQTSIYNILIHEILAQGHTDVHGQIPDTNELGE